MTPVVEAAAMPPLVEEDEEDAVSDRTPLNP